MAPFVVRVFLIMVCEIVELHIEYNINTKNQTQGESSPTSIGY